MESIELKQLVFNTFVSKGLASRLNTATNQTLTMYEMDIHVAYRLLAHVLHYEISQSGLNLTHTQDRNFIQVSEVAVI